MFEQFRYKMVLIMQNLFSNLLSRYISCLYNFKTACIHVQLSLRSRHIKERGWGRRKRIRGRERLLQKPLLLHLRLLFYGNRINIAVGSMTNQNKARVFLHD